MTLSPQEVSAYKQILSNPTQHGMDFKPIQECFQPSDKVTAKHLLFEQLISLIKVPLPKVIFYILMDEMYGDTIGKSEDGCAGYALSVVA